MKQQIHEKDNIITDLQECMKYFPEKNPHGNVNPCNIKRFILCSHFFEISTEAGRTNNFRNFPCSTYMN